MSASPLGPRPMLQHFGSVLLDGDPLVDSVTPTTADAETAFRLARRKFLAGERVEMKALAAELGVDRTTLFRWVGNRDQLLGNVLWSAAEPTFANALATMRSTGALGVAEVIGAFVQILIESEPLK